MPIILALGSWRQEDHEFKASLDYLARPYLKKPNKQRARTQILDLGESVAFLQSHEVTVLEFLVVLLGYKRVAKLLFRTLMSWQEPPRTG
jgi:hypothetical protein